MVEFSFGQIESVLSRVHDIDWPKRAAFISRLKHLQKQGIPRRGRPGKGRAGTFSPSQLMQMAVALELIQSGLPPKLAADMVLRNWECLRATVVEEAQMIAARLAEPWPSPRDALKDRFWILWPEALSDLAATSSLKNDYAEEISSISLSDLSDYLNDEAFRQTWGSDRRRIILNGSAITRSIIDVIDEFSFAQPHEMAASLHADILRDRDILEGAVKDAESGEWSSNVDAAIANVNNKSRRSFNKMDWRFARALAQNLPVAFTDLLSGKGNFGWSKDEAEALEQRGLYTIRGSYFTVTSLGDAVSSLLQGFDPDENSEDEDDVDPQA